MWSGAPLREVDEMSEPARKTDIDIAEYERRLRPAAQRAEDPLAELARLVSAAPQPRRALPVEALAPDARAALTADEENFLNELSLAIDRNHAPRRQDRDAGEIAAAQAAIEGAATAMKAAAAQAAAAERAAAEADPAADARPPRAEPAPSADSRHAPPFAHASAAIEIPALKARHALRGGFDLNGLEEMTRLEDISRVAPPRPAEAPPLPRVDLHAPVFPRPVAMRGPSPEAAETIAAPDFVEPLSPAATEPDVFSLEPSSPRDLDAALPGDDGFEPAAPAAPAIPAQAAPARRRRMTAALIAVIGVGVAASGVAFTLKRGPSPASGEPPTILASSDPVKVAPPVAPAAAADQTEDLLARKSSATRADAAAKAVGKPEEPVDLAREAQKIVRTVPIPAAPDPSTPRTPTSDSAQPDRLGSAFPEPRRVRTVSVRPDGTVIGGDPVPAAPQSAVAPTPARAAPTDATPAATQPPSGSDLSEDKPVAPRPRAAAPATQTPAATPAPPRRPAADKPAAPKPTAEKVARPAPPKPTPAPRPAAEAESRSERPSAETMPSAPVETASNPFAALFGRKEQPTESPSITASTNADDREDASPAKAARASLGTGAYAVQLSSSPSEGDARAAASRLGGRFSSQLGGRAARVVKGEAGGKAVYRVRAGGMSKEGAVAACENIKSAGGSCFVARD